MNTDNINTSSWERIQNGFQDTERLLGQKRYNECMIRARQTLEFMVKCLCERFDVSEATLVDMIDALYENGIINKTTCEHYHKIRMIGNKAVHEEDNLAYNAGQAYHLLSQEIYTFANDFTGKKKKPVLRQREELSHETSQSREPYSRTSRGSSSRSGDSVSRHSGSNRRRGSRSSGPSVDPASLLKILIPLAVIIILIFVIRLVRPGSEGGAETTAPIELETIAPTEETTQEESTEETSPAKKYKTSDTLNVRSEPSTDASKLGQLAPGTEVEYIEDYDDTWAKISFEGKEGYVSKEYLELIGE